VAGRAVALAAQRSVVEGPPPSLTLDPAIPVAPFLLLAVARTKIADRLHLGLKRLRVSMALAYYSHLGVFPIEIKSTVGLGAKLEWCLEILAYCDENGLLPQFKFSYPTSPPSADYFSSYFRINGSHEKPVRFVPISSIIELNLGRDYDTVLTIDLAHYLINKYLVIREEIVSEVETFCAQRFAKKRVLGVHYRGTDKVLESPAVSYASVRANIERYVQLYPDTERIFVATDDLEFLSDLQTSRISREVISRDDAIRSLDGRPIHESPHTDKYAVNRDAIVNCLLLSRCDALLKTSSILSDWAKLFNPQLPTVTLNEPYADHLWFPERELIKANLFEPIK
jgi:hypothetical protein